MLSLLMQQMEEEKKTFAYSAWLLVALELFGCVFIILSSTLDFV